MSVFFYWSGQRFDFGNFLAIASAALHAQGRDVVVMVDEKPVDNPHFARVERLPCVTVEYLDTAALLSPMHRRLYERMRFVAHRSDLVRFALLAERGGLYLDTDTLTCADLQEVLEVLLLSDGEIVHLGCLGLPAGHPLAMLMLEALASMPERDLDVYQSIVYRWTDVVRRHRPPLAFGDLTAYFPFHWRDWETVFTRRPPVGPIHVLHHYGYYSRRYTQSMDEAWISRNDCLYSDLARPILRDLRAKGWLVPSSISLPTRTFPDGSLSVESCRGATAPNERGHEARAI